MKILCWNYSEKWLKMTWICENWKWPLVCSNPNNSASTWQKFKIKDSFEILRTSRFQNWPYFLDLVKIWWRYCQKTNWKVFFVDTVYSWLCFENRKLNISFTTFTHWGEIEWERVSVKIFSVFTAWRHQLMPEQLSMNITCRFHDNKFLWLSF